MPFATRLNTVNAVPRRDGDVTLYHFVPPPAATERALSTTFSGGNRLQLKTGTRSAPTTPEDDRLRHLAAERRAEMLARLARREPDFVYVNGVRTDPAGHLKDAQGLSLVTDLSLVLGVYNATTVGTRVSPREFARARAGTLLDRLQPIVRVPLEAAVNAVVGTLSEVGDFFQAGGDWVTNVMFNVLELVAGIVGPFVQSGDLRRWRRETAVKYVAANAATRSLAEVLEDFVQLGRQPKIVCYSQGTVITSNALHAVRFANALPSLSAELFVCAPVPPTWPRLSPPPRLYATTLDVVPLASLNPFIWRQFATDFSAGSNAGRTIDFDLDTVIARHDLLNSYVVAANLTLVDDLRASLGRPPRRR